MQMAFTRTGGIAAVPGLQVRGTATFDGSGGEVTSAGYHRTLNPSESQSLLTDAEAARVTAASHPVAGNPRARDAYQYSIVIDIDGGQRATLRARGEAGPADPAPIARLIDWVSRETEAIAHQRLTSG
jgi:hypothetical protein